MQLFGELNPTVISFSRVTDLRRSSRTFDPAHAKSHCTRTKSFSYGAYVETKGDLQHRPGPPCRSSSKGFRRSSPRMVTHCSIRPMVIKEASSMR